MLKRALCLSVFLPVCLLVPACGNVALPSIFSDHAVFQRGQPIPVWGMAGAGQSVTVAFAKQSKTTTADARGRWRVDLDPMPAGGPHELTVCSGSYYLLRKDILVGEVWICSGQSNMQWPLAAAETPEGEIAAANYPRIRLISVPRVLADTPQGDFEGRWVPCSPETAGPFSAVGYFFGRHLHKTLDVPVGLINASWGGSAIEPWTPQAYLARHAEFKDMTDAFNQRLAEWRKGKAKALAAYEKAKKNYPLVLTRRREQIALADAGVKARWQRPATDAAGWKTMDLPQSWGRGELKDFDGVIWFRREVNVPAGWAGKDLLLRLGPVDDEDETFFNGSKVGSLGYGRVGHWQTPRRYTVPGRLVRAGRNVIVSRVLDGGGQGGFTGAAEQMSLAPARGARALSLAGAWRYKVGCKLTGGRIPNAPRAPSPPRGPGGMYNGMIAPLVPYALAGAIWYQGESNAGRPITYRRLMPALIRSWREAWDGRELCFLMVQLANFMKPAAQPGDGGWAWLREAQLMSLSVPRTGLAVTIDIGEADNIHPRNKQDVGKRLALAALRKQYGRALIHSGPIYKSMEIEGDRIRLRFKHAGGGLTARNGPLEQFAIAAADRKFVWAAARIEGETVVVSSPDVKKPVAVRYAWANNPAGCNLYNRQRLPASPFRTDDWGTQERRQKEQPRRR